MSLIVNDRVKLMATAMNSAGLAFAIGGFAACSLTLLALPCPP